MHKKSYLVVVVLVVEIDVCFPFHSMFVRFSPRTLFVSGSKILSYHTTFHLGESWVNPSWIVKSFWIILRLKPTNQRFPSSKTSNTNTWTVFFLRNSVCFGAWSTFSRLLQGELFLASSQRLMRSHESLAEVKFQNWYLYKKIPRWSLSRPWKHIIFFEEYWKLVFPKNWGELSFLRVDLTSTSSMGYTNHTWMIEGIAQVHRKHLEHLANRRDFASKVRWIQALDHREFFEETSARNKGIKTKIFFYRVGGWTKPSENMIVKSHHFPNFVNIRNIWNHHAVVDLDFVQASISQ